MTNQSQCFIVEKNCLISIHTPESHQIFSICNYLEYHKLRKSENISIGKEAASDPLSSSAVCLTFVQDAAFSYVKIDAYGRESCRNE